MTESIPVSLVPPGPKNLPQRGAGGAGRAENGLLCRALRSSTRLPPPAPPQHPSLPCLTGSSTPNTKCPRMSPGPRSSPSPGPQLLGSCCVLRSAGLPRAQVLGGCHIRDHQPFDNRSLKIFMSPRTKNLHFHTTALTNAAPVAHLLRTNGC